MRSKAAAQLLQAEGFTNIYNMSGGIIAYGGGKATGDELQGMEFFVTEDFEDAFRMGYAMEEGLKQLYLGWAELAEESGVKALLARLAKFEDGHKAKLRAKFPGTDVGDVLDVEALEGGFDKQQIFDHFRDHIKSLQDIIQIGMMLETQALDLYSRLGRKAEDEESRLFFEYMANEEKQHLKFLSDEYDILLAV